MFHSKKNIIIGRNPILEALKNAAPIDKILVSKTATGDAIYQIKKRANEHQIPIQYVPNEKLNSLTNLTHQGVLAFKALVQYQDVQQIIDFANSKGEMPLFIYLDGITDIRNIGAIARTALACGVQAIIVPSKGVGNINEEAIKASAGALEKMAICRINNIEETFLTLRLNGFQLIGAAVEAKETLNQIDLNLPFLLVMGSEDQGISTHIAKLLDKQFTIPYFNQFESLNVSVATGIILYEAMRQQKNEML